MVITVLSAWFVASRTEWKRNRGFWLYLVSNLLWILWGCHDHAYALIVLQIVLAITNIRGVAQNEPKTSRS